MGSLLSFPLLCLQNYIAFRFFVSEEECPDDHVRINGDDIVYRAKRHIIERWMGGVASLGLELSSGKTFLDGNFFSLNSTYFWACKGYVKALPVVRLGTLMRCNMGGIGTALNDFLKPFGNLALQSGTVANTAGSSPGTGLCVTRRRALDCFFHFHKSVWKKYRGSWVREIPYGLEAKILSDELRHLGLLEQERYWFITSNAAIPSIESVNNFEVPKDYRLIRRPGVNLNGNDDLFIKWHWETNIKLKNAKKVNTRYESELLRVRSVPESYVNVDDGQWNFRIETGFGYLPDGVSMGVKTYVIPDGKKKIDGFSRRLNVETLIRRENFSSRSETGFRLLRGVDRKIALNLIGTEIALIDRSIDEVVLGRLESDTKKVTSLQRKNRFDYMVRGALGNGFTFCNGSDRNVGGFEVDRIKLRDLLRSIKDLYVVGTVEDDRVEAGIKF